MKGCEMFSKVKVFSNEGEEQPKVKRGGEEGAQAPGCCDLGHPSAHLEY